MNIFKRMRLRNKLLLGFAVPVLITVALSTLIYNNVRLMGSAIDSVQHTAISIDHSNKLLGALIDMETGMRGYLVTGDTVFLDPYHSGLDAFNKTMPEAKNHVEDNPAQLASLEKIAEHKANWLNNHVTPALALRKNSDSPKPAADFISKGLGKQSMDGMRVLLAEFTKTEKTQSDGSVENANKTSSITRSISFFGALLAVLISFGTVFLTTRHLSYELGTEPYIVKRIARTIADGDLSQDLTTDVPTTGVYAAMQKMQASLKSKQEADREASAEMARIKQALDSASSAIMITDVQSHIIYQNRAASNLFKDSESEIKRVSPKFSAENLIGSHVDILQSGKCIQSDNPKDHNTGTTQDCVFGQITLGRLQRQIVGDNDQYLGHIIRWHDKTNQIAVEHEIQEVVSGVLEGNLSKRLELENKDGFFLLLSERMNELVSVCENVVNDTVRVFGAMSRYDLTEYITDEYKGSFANVKNNANQTISQLTNIIGEVKNDVTMLDNATSELSNLNKQMFNTAEISSDQASTVSNTAEQISDSIGGVASASVQVSTSINEIAGNAVDASNIASDAVVLAESTENTVRKLSDSSSDIGNVIKVISSIAEQTNLLALNATIEAARAGEAGKGFAVVANEVKELAKETAKATDEIGEKVATIQLESDSAVEAIGAIDKTIREINEIQVTIAAAVQEQKATSLEISRSVNEVADGSAEIAASSVKAATGASESLSSTTDAQNSTKELASLANELRARVDQFKVKAA